ncbi:MAG: hypothetical protein JRG91_06855 [Deltaproteobacteria bacterium]|nr:hypothetical protein [Deltaproteobacteria bacterium]
MKKEIAILASVAFGSMAAGFLIVLLILGPGEKRTLPDPFAGGASTQPDEGAPRTPAKTPGKSPARAPDEPAPAPLPEPAPSEPAADKTHAPVPPSGKLALAAGDPFIWRCWAEAGSDPLEKDRCGSLPGVEKIVSDNLGVIERCVLDTAGESATGKLSLALKLDFSSGQVKAWLGNSTTVEGMDAISGCLRVGFEDTAPPSIDHDYPRYIVFFTITVG